MNETCWWVAFYWARPQDLLPWIDFLSAYTPQIYVRNAQMLVFELGRSRSLIDTNKLLKQMKAMDGLTPFPLLGEAKCPSEAQAKAQFQKDKKAELPMEALWYYHEPFCEDAVNRGPLKKMLTDLKALGLKRLGPFMDLSEKEIGTRWSHWGRQLWLRVHGIVPLVEPKVVLEETFSEIYEFPEEAPGNQLEPLYFIAKHLLHKLHQRLQQKNYGAKQLKVILTGRTFDNDFCGSVEFDLGLPAFHHEASLWLTLLRERLQVLAQQQKLPALLESLEIAVTETLIWHGLQKDLLDPEREHREGALLESLAKLEARLGREKVFCAEPRESYRPESSWNRGSSRNWYTLVSGKKRGSSLSQKEFQVYELLSQKPLRVLPSPQRLVLKDQKVFLNNRWEPFRLSWGERVCGEFWKGSFDRYYGVVHLKAGEKLWVFKEGEDIFLQGFFV